MIIYDKAMHGQVILVANFWTLVENITTTIVDTHAGHQWPQFRVCGWLLSYIPGDTAAPSSKDRGWGLPLLVNPKNMLTSDSVHACFIIYN